MHTIACFGDSLVYGFPYANQSSWIAEVERITDIKMLNYGECGACCDDIYERLKYTFLPSHTDTILFFGGANDILQGRPQSVIIGDIKRAEAFCKEKCYGFIVVLPILTADERLNVRFLRLREAIGNEFQDRIKLIDLQPAIGKSIEEMSLAYFDGLHPKSDTYRRMGAYAAAILSKR